MTAPSEFNKKWRCGQQYKYPIPDDGKHWEKVFDPLLEEDKAQCDVWKDEVQNLLIFAGLFSGILTAFVIESYQSLQPDPNDVVVSLLTRIATRLDNPINGTSAYGPSFTPTQTPNSPTSSSIRINIFWFISLVLSLTTVLIGIVSLQWLREHQKYPNNLSAKKKLAILNMRKAALDAWHVPEIFSTLPIILQLALILFLIGLVEFLLSFGRAVSIPIIVVIGLPLLFIILTTALPTFQTFLMFLPIPAHAKTVPTPCPYKSPQAHFLRQVFTTSDFVVHLYIFIMTTAHSLVIVFPRRVLWNFQSNSTHGLYVPRDCDDHGFWSTIRPIHHAFKVPNWTSFDVEWLQLRDGYAASIVHGTLWVNRMRDTDRSFSPVYDLISSIRTVSWRNSQSSIHFSAYHCIQDITKSLLDVEYPPVENIYYVQRLLKNTSPDLPLNLHLPVDAYSSFLLEPQRDLMCDETALLFLPMCNEPLPIIGQHFLELLICRTNEVYSVPQTVPDSYNGISFPCWEAVALHTYRPSHSSDEFFRNDFSNQVDLIVKNFVQVAMDPHTEDADISSSSFASRYLSDILLLASEISKDSYEALFDLISEPIDSYLGGRTISTRDFPFYLSCLLLRYRDSKLTESPQVHSCRSILRNYLKKRGTPDPTLGSKFDTIRDDYRWYDEVIPPKGQPTSGTMECSSSKDVKFTQVTNEQKMAQEPEEDSESSSMKYPMAEDLV